MSNSIHKYRVLYAFWIWSWNQKRCNFFQETSYFLLMFKYCENATKFENLTLVFEIIEFTSNSLEII